MSEPTPSLDKLRADPRHRAARLKLALSKLLWSEIERLDITIYEAAKRARLPQQTVRHYFAGGKEPGLSKLLALDAALGRPAGWLAARLAEVA